MLFESNWLITIDGRLNEHIFGLDRSTNYVFDYLSIN